MHFASLIAGLCMVVLDAQGWVITNEDLVNLLMNMKSWCQQKSCQGSTRLLWQTKHMNTIYSYNTTHLYHTREEEKTRYAQIYPRCLLRSKTITDFPVPLTKNIRTALVLLCTLTVA